ncbi:MAG TPA: selenocysteine-specific translation elongation factor [Gemmatimonadaceae bacterium]|nr:selenocysteine-specific translation elongation factor [Gemmatimonadaceae bacterium]
MILGTAGHVDHGKTALVKALTGVDTDRLAEEKRRGITIDLGFAPLDLGEAGVLGVVDVPGHEAFVRNMLAGATGVDLVLLVVAADEGVMPQTREHLAILDLLGVRGGVIALTKVDLVDDDWLALVRDDVAALVAGTPLQGAPMVTTSVVSGRGLEELRETLARAVRALPARQAGDVFRLPIDRAFSVRGTGTVVTGTVWSGQLERDAAVRILPAGVAARVRNIESHGASVSAAMPGTRAAIALAGVGVSELGRGSVLVSDDAWTATSTLLADVALLADAPRALGPRTTVRFHLGTVEVGARVVVPGGALAPGARKHARVVLDAPIVARAGDRFVLRSASPLATIGGGMVADPSPPQRRPRPWSSDAATPAQRLAHVLEHAGPLGVTVASLPVRVGAHPDQVAQLVAAAQDARRVGDVLYAGAQVASLEARFLNAVDEHHAAFPLDPGAPLQSVRTRTTTNLGLADLIVATLVRDEKVDVSAGVVMRHGWSPTLDQHARTTLDGIARVLEAADREPPSVDELAQQFGSDALPVLKVLERQGRVVQVAPDRYYAAASLARMETELRSAMADGQERSPSELRDVLGVSRKFLIPLLEYADRTGLTVRRASGRVIGSRTPTDLRVSADGEGIRLS